MLGRNIVNYPNFQTYKEPILKPRFYVSALPHLHAGAQSLQVSKVQALPAGIQTLHHTVWLHAAGTHRHP